MEVQGLKLIGRYTRVLNPDRNHTVLQLGERDGVPSMSRQRGKFSTFSEELCFSAVSPANGVFVFIHVHYFPLPALLVP